MSASFVVGVGGTLRPGSSSERAVRAVLAQAQAAGAEVEMFGAAELAALPHYAPEAPERSPAQARLVEAVRRCDGLVIGTPGYHAGVSGLVKNALDLLEDLRDDAARPYFAGRAVGCIVTAAGWQAGGVTLQALRGVVHAMRGWPTPLGLAFNTVAAPPFGPDGPTPEAATGFAAMSREVLQFADLSRSRAA